MAGDFRRSRNNFKRKVGKTMEYKKYIQQITKRLECSKEKRLEITKDLTMDILAAEENGETLEDIKKRMGSAIDIAAEFNSNFSEEERKKYKKRRKRKKILSILSVFIVVFFIGFYWVMPKSIPIEKSKNFKEEEIVKQAENTIDLIESGNYTKLQENADQKVKKALKAEVIDQVKSDLGLTIDSKVQSFGNHYVAEVKQMGKSYGVIQLNASYENTSITYTILFDKNMKLAGLYLK